MNALYPLISCSFCNARFPPGEFLREHLMMCGNKMDLCLQCRQYVRRSMFDYHYDNNCTNSDSTIHDTSLSGSTFVDISISLMTINNETNFQNPRTRSQQSIRVRQINCICQYCGQQCHQEDRIRHQENCLMNPKNLIKISRYDTRNQLNTSYKTSYIYCKYCHIFFESSRFDDHKKSCEYIYQQFQEELQRRRQKTSDLFHRCTHCGILFTKAGFKIHQISCKRSHPYRIIQQNHNQILQSNSNHPNFFILPRRRAFYT